MTGLATFSTTAMALVAGKRCLRRRLLCLGLDRQLGRALLDGARVVPCYDPLVRTLRMPSILMKGQLSRQLDSMVVRPPSLAAREAWYLQV